MKFSIIIPTCNRNDLLAECLHLLSPEVQQAGSDYEIIVTDDSKDNIAQVLINESYPWVRWVAGPKRGPAANRNNGAKNAQGEWLIFIDDDCLPDQKLMSVYINSISTYPDTFVFEGCIKADRPKMNFVEESPVNEHGGYLWSCNFMIHKQMFEKVGGFEETFPFPAMEDVELDYRIRKQGNKVQFLKDAFVIHPWRLQKNAYSIALKRFKSSEHFIKLHPEKAVGVTPTLYMRLVYRDLKDIFTKSFEYKFRGLGGKLTHLGMRLYFLTRVSLKKLTPGSK